MKKLIKCFCSRAVIPLGMLLAGALWETSASGVVFQWSSYGWSYSPVSLSQAFNTSAVDGVTDGSYDIRVTFSPSPGSFVNTGFGGAVGSPPASGTPYISSTITGGTGGNVLLMDVNNPLASTTTTVTIDFLNAGASGVKFTLTDIDFGGATSYRDYVSGIKARAQGSGSYSVAPTLTTPSVNNVVITNNGTVNAGAYGTNAAGVAAGSANGDLTIDFGTNIINSVTFTYGNHPSFTANPTEQFVGIGNITFTPKVPEVRPALAAALCCLLPVVLRLRRRRRS